MDWNKEGALTVGQLRKALESVPDDAVVGTANFDLAGWVEKVSSVSVYRGPGVLVLSNDRHLGCFTEDEPGDEGLCLLARAR